MENEKIKLKDMDINDIIAMVNDENVDAMNELGIRYLEGEGIEKNEKKAFELFSKAGEKSIKARFNLAMCYYNGDGTEKNELLAFNMLKELVEKHNHSRSYFYLGEYYYWGGPVEIDYEKAFMYYNEALKLNHKFLDAKFCIAYAYYSGKGIEKNYETAFNMLKELVEIDKFPDAYSFLGELYYLGNGIQQDYELAIKYFNESLKYNKNIYIAKYYLGESYMLGKWVDIDYQKAKTYFEDILNENHDDAYYKLALMYSGNFGIPKNEQQSNQYFNKIELDLCVAMIYYILAINPEEKQDFNEILKLLDSNMAVIKETIAHFPLNHPAKTYYDRLAFLKNKEYNNIVERLKNKIIIKQKDLQEAILNVCSDNDVINLAKSIVE